MKKLSSFVCCLGGVGEHRVASRTEDKFYTVRVSVELGFSIVCDCPGFQFRGACRHVEEVEKRVCGWTSFLELDVSCCPRCGAEVVVVGEKEEV